MVYCKLFSWLFLSVGCYIASCKAVSHCFMLWGGAITLLHVGGRVIALIHAGGGVIITLLHVGRTVIALMRTCRGRGHHHIASCRGRVITLIHIRGGVIITLLHVEAGVNTFSYVGGCL